MIPLRWLGAILTLPCVLASSTPHQTSSIHITANKFYNEAGERFLIRGIAYQRQMPGHEHEPWPEIQKGYIDSLAHPEKCLRDIELLKELHVNTIRVYQVDPDQNHEACMHALAHNGIYVLVDLSEPKHAVNRKDPSWHTELWKHYRAVVDNMSGFENVLGFIAGNEVVTSSEDSGAAAAVKAAIRDTKRYLAAQGLRAIPVGYTANDDEATRLASLNYFTCSEKKNGSNSEDSLDTVADFYAINMFEWCGYSTFSTSGLRARTQEFAASAVPVFLSEFGCNSVRPRPFTEVEAFYGPEMVGVWSGGVAFEFFENENHYGVVAESGSVPGRWQKSAEFDTLKMRFAARSGQGEPEQEGPRAKKSTRACPAFGPASVWRASPEIPPTPDENTCECVKNLVTCSSSYLPHVFDSPELSDGERALLAEACVMVDCSAIEADPGIGEYGQWSGCAPRTKLAWALTEAARAGHECDFGGRARKRENANGIDKSCLKLKDMVFSKEQPVFKAMAGVELRSAKAHLQPLPQSEKYVNGTGTAVTSGGNSAGARKVSKFMLFCGLLLEVVVLGWTLVVLVV